MTSVAVIDHGAGNLVSMAQALTRCGAVVTVVDTADDLGRFDGVVLPGVGATGPAMRTLERTGLAEALRSFEGPLLGVCVGMQLLFEVSHEDGTRCLGLIPGEVRRLMASPLPHMGWNDVEHDATAPFSGIPSGTLFYFVHSFAPVPADDGVVIATTTYGNDRFASAVRRDGVIGVQFHPERSGSAGLTLLGGFVEGCRSQRAA
jgi:imidazole glycerol-phosphate synthase subunit HisH